MLFWMHIYVDELMVEKYRRSDVKNVEINLINKTRFKAQHFIEEIDFDYFEIEYIRERV